MWVFGVYVNVQNLVFFTLKQKPPTSKISLCGWLVQAKAARPLNPSWCEGAEPMLSEMLYVWSATKDFLRICFHKQYTISFNWIDLTILGILAPSWALTTNVCGVKLWSQIANWKRVFATWFFVWRKPKVYVYVDFFSLQVLRTFCHGPNLRNRQVLEHILARLIGNIVHKMR